MVKAYLELIIRELGSQRVKRVIELNPTMRTNGHYMNLILEYKDRQVYFPLSREEYQEYARKYKK